MCRSQDTYIQEEREDLETSRYVKAASSATMTVQERW